MDKRRDIMTPAEAVADIIAKVKTIRGDTEIDEAVLGIFEFNVAAAISSGVLNDLDFDSIKPKLNLYRKIAGFGSCRHHHN